MVNLLALLVPCPDLVRLDSLSLDQAAGQIVVSLTTISVSVACPVCATPTRRVHSGYTRRVADLPWAERQVCLQLRVRKFLCSREACPRRIFTERLPAMVRPWGRRSVRLGKRQRRIGLALGGSAGARLIHNAVDIPSFCPHILSSP